MSLIEVSNDQYNVLINNFKNIPYSQSPPWIKSRKNTGREYRFFTDSYENPSFLFAGEIHSKPLVGSFLIIDGGPLTHEDKKFQSISKSMELLTCQFDYIEIESETPISPELEVEIRRAGFVRPMLAKYCPMTIYVDLEKVKLKRNWKYNRSKAKNNGISKGIYIPSPTTNNIIEFINAFSEMKQAKGIGYIPSKKELVILLNDPKIRFYKICDDDGPLAYHIIWHCGSFSQAIYAANFDRAKECGATHQLYIDVFDDLKSIGCKTFDFGRIGPGKSELDSVFMFKRGSGGELISYSGAWVYSKNDIKEYSLMIYRKFIQKRKRW